MSNTTVTNPLAPPWLNNGDNAWQLTAASLVALQSIPGLVILYGGIVKRKWAVNSAFMAFYAFAAVLICWVLWAYQASFGTQMLPFVGRPGVVVTMNEELRQSLLPTSGISSAFPLSTMGAS
jgi:Amt family ammonium transporter